jgi:hypothetical protein
MCPERKVHVPVAGRSRGAHKKIYIPPDLVVKGITVQRKPPEVRICRLRSQWVWLF